MIDSDAHHSNPEADESPGKRARVEIGEWARVGPKVIPFKGVSVADYAVIGPNDSRMRPVATNRQRNACCQSGRST